jgi:hypothetical protein
MFYIVLCNTKYYINYDFLINALIMRCINLRFDFLKCFRLLRRCNTRVYMGFMLVKVEVYAALKIGITVFYPLLSVLIIYHGNILL